jgi:hypothetical protein
MNKQHTPGPWKFHKKEHWTIFADGKSIMGNADYYPWVPQKKSDWLLIAAAPELLEALQRLCSDELQTQEKWDNARAAIAKATKDK